MNNELCIMRLYDVNNDPYCKQRTIVKTLSPFWTKGEYALAARARITGLGSNWVGLLHYGI